MRAFEGQVGEPVVRSFRATPAWKALADAAERERERDLFERETEHL